MKRTVDNIAGAVVNCRCGLLFLGVGLLPLLAFLNLLPRGGDFGGRPLFPVLGGFSFAGVGLYFNYNFRESDVFQMARARSGAC